MLTSLAATTEFDVLRARGGGDRGKPLSGLLGVVTSGRATIRRRGDGFEVVDGRRAHAVPDHLRERLAEIVRCGLLRVEDSE